MKRIVLCFDGTWNKPADENLPSAQQVETNVRRFYESLKETGTDGAKQVKWYDEGVGTHWYDQFIGGAIGTGLEVNIIQGYEFLAKNYEGGDEVYVLGFSRGAYTARSLVGMVRNCGLIEAKHVALRVGIAYGIYRTRDDGPDSMTAKLFRSSFCREIRIKFIGVWDTVGALGIPHDIVKGLSMKFYEFHDTELSGIVENAYHAAAADEHRQDYDVCLWNPQSKPGQTMEQRWFIGAHCDYRRGLFGSAAFRSPAPLDARQGKRPWIGTNPAGRGRRKLSRCIHRFIYGVSQGPLREEKSAPLSFHRRDPIRQRSGGSVSTTATEDGPELRAAK